MAAITCAARFRDSSTAQVYPNRNFSTMNTDVTLGAHAWILGKLVLDNMTVRGH